MKTVVRDVFTPKVTVRTPTGPKRLTTIEAILHKLKEKAFAGDERAISRCLALYPTAVSDEPADREGGGEAATARTEQEVAAFEALRELIADEMRVATVGEEA